MPYFLAAVSGYLIGCVNISYLYGKIRGMDIRETGTKNPGATNAFLTYGPVMGIVTALCDIGKTVLAYTLARALFSAALIGTVAAAACVLGHIFPFYMRWRGGRGTAAFGGFVLAADWQVFFALLALMLVLIAVTDYGIISVCISSALYPVYLLIVRAPLVSILITATLILVFFAKHIAALKRTFAGTEVRISSFWKSPRSGD